MPSRAPVCELLYQGYLCGRQAHQGTTMATSTSRWSSCFWQEAPRTKPSGCLPNSTFLVAIIFLYGPLWRAFEGRWRNGIHGSSPWPSEDVAFMTTASWEEALRPGSGRHQNRQPCLNGVSDRKPDRDHNGPRQRKCTKGRDSEDDQSLSKVYWHAHPHHSHCGKLSFIVHLIPQISSPRTTDQPFSFLK